MTAELDRRQLFGIAGGALTSAYVAGPRPAGAIPAVKGQIPADPVKFGHMTFFSGPGAVLGEGSFKGHTLAAEEINAEGGFLKKRKIVTITADEAAGTDANVKELRRMKLSENIDWFTGVIAAHNTLALGPVAEELQVPSFFTDGCADPLFEKLVQRPQYVFRATNILSSDAIALALAVHQTWPEVRRIAHIHPDYMLGRYQQLHFQVAIKKKIPQSESVFEAWPKLGTSDFNAHIAAIIAANPDLLVTSLWGGDYVNFYKQALRQQLFDKMKFASNLGFGSRPQSLGKDHPEGILAGVHGNYHFTYPPGDRWPVNKRFVEAYYKRWNEYPALEAEGAYTALYLIKQSIEKANQLVGGWPEPEMVIQLLKGSMIQAPSGYVYVRPDDNSAMKDVAVGFSKNLAEYAVPVWDPDRVMVFPIRSVTAPADWPKPGQGHEDPSAAYNWINKTW
jgi:branched-chain amino acid transport system substrate-binding protein